MTDKTGTFMNVSGDPVQQHEVLDQDGCVLGYLKTFSRDMTNGYGDEYNMRVQLVYQSCDRAADQLQDPIVLKTGIVERPEDFLFMLDAMWMETLECVNNHEWLKEWAGLKEL